MVVCDNNPIKPADDLWLSYDNALSDPWWLSNYNKADASKMHKSLQMFST